MDNEYDYLPPPPPPPPPRCTLSELLLFLKPEVLLHEVSVRCNQRWLYCIDQLFNMADLNNKAYRMHIANVAGGGGGGGNEILQNFRGHLTYLY